MAEYVQESIRYRFNDVGLLYTALRAPHRSNKDGTTDDGNRRFVRLGISIIDMVETHEIVKTDGRTKSELRNIAQLVIICVLFGQSPTRTGKFDSCQCWSKTKAGRANACKKLGIDSCIVQSIRQQQEPPSTNVLANAMSAVIAAVWLDHEQQGESTATARMNVCEILRHIDSIIRGTSQDPIAMIIERNASDLEENNDHEMCEGIPRLVTPDHTISRDAVSMDELILQHSGLSQQDTFEDCLADFLPPYDIPSNPYSLSLNELQDSLNPPLLEGEAEFGYSVLPQQDATIQQSESMFWYENEGSFNAFQACSSGAGPSQTTTSHRRKRTHKDELRDNSLPYYSLLRMERQKLFGLSNSDRTSLEVYLEHPCIGEISQVPAQLNDLRSLYLGIGSHGTLVDFKELLLVARKEHSSSLHDCGRNMNLTERFNEICSLDDKEALCVLTRRYLIIEFCETHIRNFRQENWITVETVNTFDEARKPQLGNPNMLREAATTAQLASQLQPGVKPGDNKFKRLCDKIKRFRKLARNLQMLTSVFGVGILALIPSGSSYQDLCLTDTALVPWNE
ncbi:hypothetical protein J1614_000060 [Plenodomus biglobosus]|nr:hypothetical protein J1614_000060 [Plenodomus biglobosus]